MSFEYLSSLREYWIRIGHKDVPHANCSCGFKGLDKPGQCSIHNFKSNLCGKGPWPIGTKILIPPNNGGIIRIDDQVGKERFGKHFYMDRHMWATIIDSPGKEWRRIVIDGKKAWINAKAIDSDHYTIVSFEG